MSLVAEVFEIPPNRLTDGELGVEIEVEGEHLPTKLKYWVCTRDGSLNDSGMEYVFVKPLSVATSFMALEELKARYKANESTIHDSVRAGIHVHMNMQKYSIVQLHNIITTYLLFEGLLVNFCGEEREGNLFCLRASDAKSIIHLIRNACKQASFRSYGDENFRYASMNLCSLWKFGSLEFRSMRSTPDFESVKNWINLLISVRDFALSFESPDKIIHSLSEGGFHKFAEDCFRGNLHLFNKSEDEITEYITKGVRSVQLVAFATDWRLLLEKLSNRPVVKGGKTRIFDLAIEAMQNPQVQIRPAPRPQRARLDPAAWGQAWIDEDPNI